MDSDWLHLQDYKFLLLYFVDQKSDSYWKPEGNVNMSRLVGKTTDMDLIYKHGLLQLHESNTEVF